MQNKCRKGKTDLALNFLLWPYYCDRRVHSVGLPDDWGLKLLKNKFSVLIFFGKKKKKKNLWNQGSN